MHLALSAFEANLLWIFEAKHTRMVWHVIDIQPERCRMTISMRLRARTTSCLGILFEQQTLVHRTNHKCGRALYEMFDP